MAANVAKFIQLNNFLVCLWYEMIKTVVVTLLFDAEIRVMRWISGKILNLCVNYIMRNLFMAFAVLLAVLSATAAGYSDRGRRLVEQCRVAVDGRNYAVLRAKGDELRRLGAADGNEAEEVAGICHILGAAIATHDTIAFDREIEFLKSHYDKFREARDYEIAPLMARTLGKYYHFIYNAYSSSLQYYLEALEMDRAAGNHSDMIADLSAIAVMYLHKGDDPAGMDYAVKAYNEAKHLGHQPSLYVTAANLGNYLYNEGKYTEALAYVEEARAIASGLHYDMERVYIDTFMASIYESLGNKKQAERHYRHSLAGPSGTTRYDMIYARIKYASFLSSEGRYAEAMQFTDSIEDMTERFGMRTFAVQVYPLAAECREGVGDYKGALDYQRKYIDVSRRIFSEERERELAILDLRYKVSEEKRINAAQSLDLMRRKRQVELAVGVALLLLLAGVLMVFYHRKHVASLKAIVRSHLDKAEAERQLKERYQRMLDEINGSQLKPSGLDSDRGDELFHRLESLMNDDKAYRQCDMSLEKAAAMLGTNRTYLSQVVNSHAGSFSTYVNRYRLSEAIALLSDPANDDSLKNIGLSVGFTSPSNFYSLFRQKVGMAPSVFRQNVRDISSEASDGI